MADRAMTRTILPRFGERLDLSCGDVLTNTSELCNDFFYDI